MLSKKALAASVEAAGSSVTELLGYDVDTMVDGYDSTVLKTVTVNYPSGIQSGDLLILVLAEDLGNRINSSTPTFTGFNLVVASSNVSSSVGFKLFYRIANGTESGTITCNETQLYVPAAIMARFSLSDTVSLVNASINTTTAVDPNPPSVTASITGTEYLVITAGIYDDGKFNSVQPVSAPSGYTKVADRGTIAASGTGSIALCLAYNVSTTQANDPSSFSQNGSTNDVVGGITAIFTLG